MSSARSWNTSKRLLRFLGDDGEKKGQDFQELQDYQEKERKVKREKEKVKGKKWMNNGQCFQELATSN